MAKEIIFRQVFRNAKKGDLLVFNPTEYSYLTSGKPYEVIEVYDEGDIIIIDDNGDEFNTFGDKFEVYEQVGSE